MPRSVLVRLVARLDDVSTLQGRGETKDQTRADEGMALKFLG
jgi:hypothetical protein